MSMTIRRESYEIEVSTEAELRVALRVLDELGSHASANHPLGSTVVQAAAAEPAAPSPSADAVNPEVAALIAQKLTPKGARFLDALLERGEQGSADYDLRTAIPVTTNTELSGVIAGLHKLARRVARQQGLSLTGLFSPDERIEGESRVLWYTLTPQARSAFTPEVSAVVAAKRGLG